MSFAETLFFADHNSTIHQSNPSFPNEDIHSIFYNYRSFDVTRNHHTQASTEIWQNFHNYDDEMAFLSLSKFGYRYQHFARFAICS